MQLRTFGREHPHSNRSNKSPAPTYVPVGPGKLPAGVQNGVCVCVEAQCIPFLPVFRLQHKLRACWALDTYQLPASSIWLSLGLTQECAFSDKM
jgi:hypothetical protein